MGTGKDTLANYFGPIFGKHYIHISNQTHLTGKFNNHLKDALFAFVDEGFFAGDKAAAGVLKSMITDDRRNIEPKGKNAYPVKNHINLIMASNENWIVPAGLEERRFCVLDVADSISNNGRKVQVRKNKKWFEPIYKEMNNGGRAAMLYDLLELDISDVDLRDIPRTDALFEQILENAHPVHKFWFDKLKDGEDSDIWENWIELDSLYNEFISFAEIGKHRIHGFMKNTFVQILKQVCPGIKKSRTDNNTKTGYTIHSLEKCRQLFSERVEMSIDWEI